MAVPRLKTAFCFLSLVAVLSSIAKWGVKPYLIMCRETCLMDVCEQLLRCHNLGPLGLGHLLRCQVGLISVAKKGAARRFTRDPATTRGRFVPALSLVVSVTLHGVACVEFADGLRALSVARIKLRASRTTSYQAMIVLYTFRLPLSITILAGTCDDPYFLSFELCCPPGIKHHHFSNSTQLLVGTPGRTKSEATIVLVRCSGRHALSPNLVSQ